MKRAKGFGCFEVCGYWVIVDFGLRPLIHAMSKANEGIFLKWPRAPLFFIFWKCPRAPLFDLYFGLILTISFINSI